MLKQGTKVLKEIEVKHIKKIKPAETIQASSIAQGEKLATRTIPRPPACIPVKG